MLKASIMKLNIKIVKILAYIVYTSEVVHSQCQLSTTFVNVSNNTIVFTVSQTFTNQ